MPRKSDLTFLLLSGGSLVGQNIVQALGDRRHSIRLVATNSAADEPSLSAFDEVFLVPPTSADPIRFEEIIMPLVLRLRPDLVIPCRDDDVAFLSRMARGHPDLAETLLCGHPDLAEAMLDKWGSWELANRHGLPFVPTIVPKDRNAIDKFAALYGLPLLVKPRSGFASRDVMLIVKGSQLDAVTGNIDIVVQQYLGTPDTLNEYLQDIDRQGIPLFHSFETTKHSLQSIIAPDGTILGACTTLHRMRNGVSMEIERDFDKAAGDLLNQCTRAFSNAGWRGPLNIQCQQAPDGQLKIYEFNGRFTGATAARHLLGFDEVALAVEGFTGSRLPPETLQPCKRVVRQPISRGLHEDVCSSLRKTGHWLGG